MKKNENEKDDMTKPSGKVKIKCMVPSGWTIYDERIGQRIIQMGETIEFDPLKKKELHTLLQVIKIVNTPKINEIEYRDRITKRTERRKKFEIVSGIESLPQCLQTTKLSRVKYNQEEIDAILSLVSDYFDKEEALYKIRR
jgi:hypothetical protein